MSLKSLTLAAAAVVALQVLLGIFTVITQVSLPFAALHQFMALALFGASLWLVYTLQRRSA